jgi:hypothetical protein
MRQFIRGKRTYIVAGIMAVVSGLKIFGVIDPVTYEGIMGVLGALGFGALRAGVEKATVDIQGACASQGNQ